MVASYHFLSIPCYKISLFTYSRAVMAPTFSPYLSTFLGKMSWPIRASRKEICKLSPCKKIYTFFSPVARCNIMYAYPQISLRTQKKKKGVIPICENKTHYDPSSLNHCHIQIILYYLKSTSLLVWNMQAVFSWTVYFFTLDQDNHKYLFTDTLLALVIFSTILLVSEQNLTASIQIDFQYF